MMDMAKSINLMSEVHRAFDTSVRDFKPTYAILAHLMSEVGELAEAVEHHQGHLPYKTMKEPVEGEAADVIQCVCALMRRIYPDMSNDDLAAMLTFQLNKKTTKWASVLTERASDAGLD